MNIGEKAAVTCLVRCLGRLSPGKMKRDIRKACRAAGIIFSSYKEDGAPIYLRHHASREDLRGVAKFFLRGIAEVNKEK